MIHSSIGEPLILSNYLDTSTVKLIRLELSYFHQIDFSGTYVVQLLFDAMLLDPIIAADEAGHKTPQQKYVHT